MHDFTTETRMNKHHKNLSILLFAMLIIEVFMAGFFTCPTYAASGKWKKLDANVETLTPASIKISWASDKNVVKWKVQLGKLKHPKTDSSERKGTFHTVATLKKGSTSYTIKGLNKDNYYYFRILGYTKNKGKLILTYKTYEQQLLGRTGICVPYLLYDEYLDYHFSPTEIGLPIAVSDYGVKPDYYQIYRKNCDVSDSKYKKIATIKSDKAYYMDKSVLPGNTYLYKVRSYKTINGKKVYSLWSSAEKITAVNQYGTFHLKKISASEDDKTLIVQLTSDMEYNADLCFLHNNNYNFSLKNKAPSSYTPLQLISYSKDSVSWTDVLPSGTDITLKSNQSVYFKLKIASDTQNDMSNATGLYINMIYNNINGFLDIPFDGNGMTDTDL